MSSIRKTKKAIKRSNGRFILVIYDKSYFCMLKWYALRCPFHTIRYHKKGISIDDSEYLPYTMIRRVINGKKAYVSPRKL